MAQRIRRPHGCSPLMLSFSRECATLHGAVVQSELKEWINAPPEGCCLESCEPVLQWIILMQGPEACGGRSLYDGEVFR